MEYKVCEVGCTCEKCNLQMIHEANDLLKEIAQIPCDETHAPNGLINGVTVHKAAKWRRRYRVRFEDKK